jgi:hypothetical protein
MDTWMAVVVVGIIVWVLGRPEERKPWWRG